MTSRTDPLYPDQWHFDLLRLIERLWDDYSGAGVSVAVYDDGVQYDHPDLEDRYDPTLHFVFGGSTRDPYPTEGFQFRGTAVAGLIGASWDNGEGGAGVAGEVGLTGVSTLFDTTTERTAAFAHMEAFDVAAYVIGSVPRFSSSQSLADPGSTTFADVAALSGAVADGREGLGTVVLLSAGHNNGNANGDGLNATRYTVSVAGLDRDGMALEFGNWGANLLVSTAAAGVTTDLTGADGRSPGDYSRDDDLAGGETGLAAGVVALMLEAAPGLGWRDVQEILAVTARHTGSEYGAGSAGFEQGEWFSNSAGTWNGGGMTYHLSYGYGAIDPFAAVRLAEIWHYLRGETPATSANEVSAEGAYSGGTVTIGTAVTLDAEVAADIAIESAEITVTFTHSVASDVSFVLVGPNGEEITLLAQDLDASIARDGLTWTFGVAALRGVSSAGTWQLRVANGESTAGTVSDFGIVFHGRATSRDDVHHVTPSFRSMVEVEGARGTLRDGNGGTDWLAFTGITGNLDVDLRGGVFSVSGNDWGRIADTSFENMAGGDGADTVMGHAGANVILGMRGADQIRGGGGADELRGGDQNDALWGQGGADQLYGGRGNDRLYGGAGADLLVGRENDDRLWGQQGNDRIEGGLGDDELWGNGGADRLYGFVGNDTLYGGAGADRLEGEGGNDVLRGGGGNDTVLGGAGNDRLFGNAGADELLGGGGNDRLFGGGMDDTLNGQGGSDRLFGGGGNDTLLGAAGTDRLNGQAGDDRLLGGARGDLLNGGAGDDVLNGQAGNDELLGGGGSDTLLGGGGDDRMDGGMGADLLRGGAGDDTMFGEDGVDRLFGEAGDDQIRGGDGNDRLFGGDGNDYLNGDLGDDILFGGDGNDRIEGRDGNDILTGGAGRDTFIFEAIKPGDDRITDFDIARDRFEFVGTSAALVTVGYSGADTLIFYRLDATATARVITLEGVILTEAQIEGVSDFL